MKNKKRQKLYKESGSKKNVFLCHLFSLPNRELQQICLHIKSPSTSRKVSGSTGGAVVLAQTQIWLYSSLYLLPQSTTAPKVRSLKLNCKDVICCTCSLAQPGWAKERCMAHTAEICAECLKGRGLWEVATV